MYILTYLYKNWLGIQVLYGTSELVREKIGAWNGKGWPPLVQMKTLNLTSHFYPRMLPDPMNSSPAFLYFALLIFIKYLYLEEFFLWETLPLKNCQHNTNKTKHTAQRIYNLA